ncbi:MAG: tRNA (adenosine(37)-N6)-threonylcarbamoyltransferase complex dimerization subunit type 1 TsaB [Lachnospiraceae bacterium]
MKILAIDSSGLVASVAVLEDDRLLAEYTIDYKKTHSQTLLPMLNEVKRMIELDLTTIDVVAVAAGPGSFTGLRIGSATAKGIAEALDKPIAEIPTMDAMAFQLIGYEGIICPIMDARRNQVYTGYYSYMKKEKIDQTVDAFNETGFTFMVEKPQFVADMHEVIEELNAIGRPVMFLGDGVPVQNADIRTELKVPYGFAPANCNRQHASAVAVLAAHYVKEGKLVKAFEHKPEYLRLSQAERERMEKEHVAK